jgi:hypothetical protein
MQFCYVHIYGIAILLGSDIRGRWRNFEVTNRRVCKAADKAHCRGTYFAKSRGYVQQLTSQNNNGQRVPRRGQAVNLEASEAAVDPTGCHPRIETH